MFITIGVLFVVFEGTSALEGLYDARGATDLAFAVEWWVTGVAESVPLSLALAVVAVLLAGFLLYRRARRGENGPGTDPGKDPAGHEG
jgi:ribose/xylose/arabinose/galactoside ABC-type transport system permease subunit